MDPLTLMMLASGGISLFGGAGGLGGIFGGGGEGQKRPGHVSRAVQWVAGCERYGIGSSVCPAEKVALRLPQWLARPHYAPAATRLQALVQRAQGPYLAQQGYRPPISYAQRYYL
jgi:hypothetical protein